MNISLKNIKVRVSDLTEKDLKEIKKVQLKKLADLKAKGFTKEQLYSKFPKKFVDENYR